jgi:hypothetical protein
MGIKRKEIPSTAQSKQISNHGLILDTIPIEFISQ